MDGPDVERVAAVLEERLSGIGRELTGRMDRLEESTTSRIDRLDASINGRFGRTEKRLSGLELEWARAQGAAEERAAHGLPAAPPPAPAVEPLPAGAGPADLPRWVRVFAAVCAAVATLGGLIGAVAAVLDGKV